MKETYNLNGQIVNAKKFIEYVKKYNHSPLGQTTRAKWILKHKKRINKYNKEYLKNRRIKAIQEGICTTCFKKIAENPNYKTCITCREKVNNK